MKPLFFILIILFTSCAKTDEQLADSAKREAKYFLSNKNCTKARSVLNDVGPLSNDAVWVGLMASTYACDAGYSELDTLFNSGDLAKLDATKLLTSLTTFSSSNESEADSDVYKSLKTAINLILDSDGESQPSAAKKMDKFGVSPGTDLNVQALYMVLVITGKFFAYYGNTNSLGAKGLGDLGNSCIYSYSATDATNFVDAALGGNTCNSHGSSEGSDDLESPLEAATIKTRLCEGIIWFNNLFDILNGIALSDSESLGDLKNVKAAVDSALDQGEIVEAAFNTENAGKDAISTLRVITGQDECEEVAIEKIEKYYAIVFEGLLE